MDDLPIRFTTRLLLTVLLLGFILRSIEPVILWKTIHSVDIGLLSLAILLFFPAQLLAAYRWYFLIGKLDRPVPFWAVLRHNMLGQFSALALPGQISGDVMRTISIADGQRGKSTFVLSVMIDKAALLAAMGAFALLGVLGSRLLSHLLGVRLVAMGLLIVALSAVFVLCRYRSDYLFHWLIRFSSKTPAAVQRWLSRTTASQDIPQLSARTILAVLMLAIALQLVNTIGSFMLARSMHITINLIEWAAINAIVSVVQVFPVTIGGLGIREGLFAGILALYAVPVAQAIAFSLTSFVIVAVLISIGWFMIDLLYVRKLQPARSGQ